MNDLLHEALESNFTYMPSKLLDKHDPKKFVFPNIIPEDALASFFSDDYQISRGTNANLLTPEEEKQIFIHYNYLKREAKTLVRMYNQRRRATIATKLVETYIEIGKVKDVIAYANIRLVLKFAHKQWVKNKHVDLDVMLSEAGMTMNRCIDKFQVDMGFRFNTLCVRSILRGFIRFYHPVTEKYKHVSYTQEDAPQIAESRYNTPVEQVAKAEMLDKFKQAIYSNAANLSRAEQIAINARFIADEQFTLEELGKVLGSTKEWARQVQNKALEKLKTYFEENMAELESVSAAPAYS